MTTFYSYHLYRVVSSNFMSLLVCTNSRIIQLAISFLFLLSDNSNLLAIVSGMVYNKGETHGKMEFMAQLVQFHLGKTSLIPSKQKTKLVVISTSHHLLCTRQLGDMVPSESIVVLEFQYLSLHLLMISLYLLETCTREVTG